MRNGKWIGLLAVAATFLFAGCSGSVEVGPVPTITPRPTVTPAPTPTPVVIVESDKTEVKEESVYDTKKFKEYYEKENRLPQLDEAYKDLFTVGLEALQIDITDPKRQAIVKEHFNSLSVKNDLSPNYLMDLEATVASGDLNRIALDFSGADVILKFAQENNIPVRGPKLITNETPAWAFTKDFSEDQVAEGVDETGAKVTTIEYAEPDVIMARMENYITDVITYCNTNYPGLVISWDILDDVINANERHEKKYRTSSYWYQGLGDDYLVKACEIARKVATKEQKLFWTQDALDEKATLYAAVDFINMLKSQNLIDGVGIQMHYNPNGPNVFLIDDMFDKLVATGAEIHITEFFVDTNEGQENDLTLTKEELYAKATKRYKNLMTTITNYEIKKSYDIVSLTLEGLTDDTSYLNEPKEYTDIATGEMVYGVRCISYPYLFDEEVNVKECFFSFLRDVSIKGY